MKYGIFTLALLCGAAAVASAQEASLSLGDTARLVSKGTAARINASLDGCAAGTQTSISVDCNQRAGNKIATGFGFTQDFICQGGTETRDILVRSFNIPFKKGQLVCSGNAFVCNEFECRSVRTEEVVSVTAK